MTKLYKTCEKCKYYSKSECHKYPPQVMSIATRDHSTTAVTLYPEVGMTDWCGEFEENEAQNVDAEDLKKTMRQQEWGLRHANPYDLNDPHQPNMVAND